MKLLNKIAMGSAVAVALAATPVITYANGLTINDNTNTEFYVACGPTAPTKHALPVKANSSLGPLAFILLNGLYFGGTDHGVCAFYSDSSYTTKVATATIKISGSNATVTATTVNPYVANITGKNTDNVVATVTG